MPQAEYDNKPEWPLCYIDGQAINIDSMPGAVERAMQRARNGCGFTFYTLNLDHLAKRRQNRDFRRIYDRATFVSADGAPVVWLSRAVGVEIERTTGADMVWPMAAECARLGIPVFLFGSNDAVLAKAVARLTAAFPGLAIAGTEAPAMGFDPTSEAAEAAADRVAASGAGVCFVALGAPKQEFFADMALQRHPQLGLFCIGAALDFIAGTQRRAPGFMARNGLEWLWRLSQNPKRMTERYVKSALMFAWLAMPWQLERVVNAAGFGRSAAFRSPARASSPAYPAGRTPTSTPTSSGLVEQPNAMASNRWPQDRGS
ncbi:MAG: WecB/TagA/CpsF family glycosyltransferase [Ancalomicrobiaceae bacterium]|nr:WecB/TagA/CpsF family glycosyltransferase [Ancalomicrobiaceae bacterium]